MADQPKSSEQTKPQNPPDSPTPTEAPPTETPPNEEDSPETKADDQTKSPLPAETPPKEENPPNSPTTPTLPDDSLNSPDAPTEQFPDHYHIKKSTALIAVGVIIAGLWISLILTKYINRSDEAIIDSTTTSPSPTPTASQTEKTTTGQTSSPATDSATSN